MEKTTATKTETHQCSTTVHEPGRGFWKHQCPNTAKHQEAGKWYCGLHAPSKVAARNEKRRQEANKGYQAEQEIKAIMDRRAAAISEATGMKVIAKWEYYPNGQKGHITLVITDSGNIGR